MPNSRSVGDQRGLRLPPGFKFDNAWVSCGPVSTHGAAIIIESFRCLSYREQVKGFRTSDANTDIRVRHNAGLDTHQYHKASFVLASSTRVQKV